MTSSGGSIEGFHDLFSLDQAGRDEFPRNQTNIFIDPRNGSLPIALSGGAASGTFARDLLLTFQHDVTCGTAKWPAFSWAVTGRYSLGNPGDLEIGLLENIIEFDNSPDFGVHAAWTQRF
jgi:hypothetical protein